MVDTDCVIEVNVTVPPPVVVDVTVPEPVDVLIEQLLVGVEITPVPPIEVEVTSEVIEVVIGGLPGPAGPPGPPGPPGPGGSQEIYVQTTEPAQGASPWFLAQLDAPGGTVEFVKVYEP